MQPLSSNDEIIFDRWFTNAFLALSKLDNGDGALVALATACYLYERYCNAALKRAQKECNKDNRMNQFIVDFNISLDVGKEFWRVIRDGLLHQGMPMQKKDFPKWQISGGYDKIIELTKDNPPVLKIEPWKFVEHVVKLWHGDITLLRVSDSFPLAEIRQEEHGFSTGSPEHNPGGGPLPPITGSFR